MELENLVGVSEVARMLSLSRQGIYNLIMRREIPFYRVAGKCRFDKEEIKTWVKEHKVETFSELSKKADAILEGGR